MPQDLFLVHLLLHIFGPRDEIDLSVCLRYSHWQILLQIFDQCHVVELLLLTITLFL